MREQITKENVEDIIIIDDAYNAFGYGYSMKGEYIRLALIDSKYLNKVGDDFRRADGCKVLFNPLQDKNGKYEDYDLSGWYNFYLTVEKIGNKYQVSEFECQVECTEDDDGSDEYYIEISPTESEVICDYINADGYLDELFEMEDEDES